MNPSFDLESFLERIRERVGRAGSVVIRHPAETRPLQSIPHDELIKAAADHQLRCVPRLQGGRYEFMHLAKA